MAKIYPMLLMTVAFFAERDTHHLLGKYVWILKIMTIVNLVRMARRIRWILILPLAV